MTSEPSAPVDPRIAYAIDARTLSVLLPGSGHGDTRDIRSEFARYLTSREGRGHATWQAAWNTWTDARPNRPGAIVHTPARCIECHGRRFSTRNISRNLTRTGSPTTCGACDGSGRGQRTTLTALFANETEDSPK